MQKLPAEAVGILSRDLGAGRIRKEDTIDASAGIILHKKVGDFVAKGEVLAELHTNQNNIVDSAVARLEQLYVLQDTKIEKPKTILGIQA